MFPVYYDQKFNKRRLKKLINGCFLKYGGPKTLQLVENLKTKGFVYSTHAGLSLNIEDLTLSPSKPSICQHVKTKFESIQLGFWSGVLNFNVYLTLYLDLWNNATGLIKDEVVVCFQAYDTLNPVYMMAFSGARGNISQVRQLVGCRGLMTDANNNVVTYGIGSNFREGLTVSEYVVSCSGARKGVVDTALRTATAGYLTRRLVDSVQHVVVRRLDCGSGLSVLFQSRTNPPDLGGDDIAGRLLGRVLKQTLLDPRENVLGRNNDEISARMLEKCTGLKACRVRSPVTCAFNRHVCRRCYGWNSASLNMVDMGSCVGILAGQSIGEPGTQLTMRTFHTGGVFTGETSHQLYTPVGGWVFLPVIPGQCVRSRTGQIGFMTKAEGHLYIVQGDGPRFTPQAKTQALSYATAPSGGNSLEAKLNVDQDHPTDSASDSFVGPLASALGKEPIKPWPNVSPPVVYRFSFPPFSFLHLKHGENISCGQTLGTFFESKGILKLRRMYGRLLSPVSGMVKTVASRTVWPETTRAFRTTHACITLAIARQFLPWKTKIRDFALPRLNLHENFVRPDVSAKKLYPLAGRLYEKRQKPYNRHIDLWLPRNGQPDKRRMVRLSPRLEHHNLIYPLLSGFYQDANTPYGGYGVMHGSLSRRLIQARKRPRTKNGLWKTNFLYGTDSNQSWFTLRVGQHSGFRDEPLNFHRRHVDRRKGTALLQQMRRNVMSRLLLIQPKPYHGQSKVNLQHGHIWVLSCGGSYLNYIDQDLPYKIGQNDLTPGALRTGQKPGLYAPEKASLAYAPGKNPAAYARSLFSSQAKSSVSMQSEDQLALAVYKTACAKKHFLVHTYKSNQRSGLGFRVLSCQASLTFSTHFRRHATLETTPRALGYKAIVSVDKTQNDLLSPGAARSDGGEQKSRLGLTGFDAGQKPNAFWTPIFRQGNILNLWSQFCKTTLKQEKTLDQRRFLSPPGCFTRRHGFIGCRSKRIFFPLARKVNIPFEPRNHERTVTLSSLNRNTLRFKSVPSGPKGIVSPGGLRAGQGPGGLRAGQGPGGEDKSRNGPLPGLRAGQRPGGLRAGQRPVKTFVVRKNQFVVGTNLKLVGFWTPSLEVEAPLDVVWALIFQIVSQMWKLFFLKQNAAWQGYKAEPSAVGRPLVRQTRRFSSGGLEKSRLGALPGLRAGQGPMQTVHGYMVTLKNATFGRVGVCSQNGVQNINTRPQWRPKWPFAFHSCAFEDELNTEAFVGSPATYVPGKGPHVRTLVDPRLYRLSDRVSGLFQAQDIRFTMGLKMAFGPMWSASAHRVTFLGSYQGDEIAGKMPVYPPGLWSQRMSHRVHEAPRELVSQVNHLAASAPGIGPASSVTGRGQNEALLCHANKAKAKFMQGQNPVCFFLNQSHACWVVVRNWNLVAQDKRTMAFLQASCRSYHRMFPSQFGLGGFPQFKTQYRSHLSWGDKSGLWLSFGTFSKAAQALSKLEELYPARKRVIYGRVANCVKCQKASKRKSTLSFWRGQIQSQASKNLLQQIWLVWAAASLPFIVGVPCAFTGEFLSSACGRYLPESRSFKLAYDNLLEPQMDVAFYGKSVLGQVWTLTQKAREIKVDLSHLGASVPGKSPAAYKSGKASKLRAKHGQVYTYGKTSSSYGKGFLSNGFRAGQTRKGPFEVHEDKTYLYAPHLKSQIHVHRLPLNSGTDKERSQADQLCKLLDILPCGNISWLQRQMEVIYARTVLKRQEEDLSRHSARAFTRRLRAQGTKIQTLGRDFFIRYEQCYPSNVYRQANRYTLKAPFSQAFASGDLRAGNGLGGLYVGQRPYTQAASKNQARLDGKNIMGRISGSALNLMAPTHASVQSQNENFNPDLASSSQNLRRRSLGEPPILQDRKAYMGPLGTVATIEKTRPAEALTLILQGFYVDHKVSADAWTLDALGALGSPAAYAHGKGPMAYVSADLATPGRRGAGQRPQSCTTSPGEQKRKEVVWAGRRKPDSKRNGLQSGLKTRILTLQPEDVLGFNGRQWARFAMGTLFSQGQTLHGHVMPHSGCLIFVHRQGMLLRRGRSFLLHQTMHALKQQNDFVTQGADLLEYPYRQIPKAHLTTGVVKVEGLFEMRSQKTLNLALNVGLYRAYRGYSGFANLPQFQYNIVLKMTLSAVHYVLNTVQRVLIGQGVTLSDKHIEIILKTMSSRVGVQRVGASGFVSGDALHRSLAFGPLAPKALVVQPFIMGISGASYRAQGFLSPASFQETSRMLARGVMYQSYDFLYGLKEKVICGHHMDIGYDYLRRTWFRGGNDRFSGDDLYVWFASDQWNPKPQGKVVTRQKRPTYLARKWPKGQGVYFRPKIETPRQRLRYGGWDPSCFAMAWEKSPWTRQRLSQRDVKLAPAKRAQRSTLKLFLIGLSSHTLDNGFHRPQHFVLDQEDILFEKCVRKLRKAEKRRKKALKARAKRARIQALRNFVLGLSKSIKPTLEPT